MRRDILGAGMLWILLTAVGEYFALSIDFYPQAMSDKGEEIEHAFKVLLAMSVPVFTMVVAAVIYSVLVHRSSGTPEVDGPHITGRGAVPVAWLTITAALTALVIVYPGLTSLDKVVGSESDPDLAVEVTGVQWTWLVSYPDDDVQNSRQLVLPVGRKVTFKITSLDVLHSFWVPAFLMKIDAVPGLTSEITLVPTEEGDYSTNPMLRLQCTELCGLSHSRMQIPVRVVSDEEFAAWVAENKDEPSPSPSDGGDEVLTLEITAKDVLFDVDTLEAVAGEPFDVVMRNEDAGVPHNVSIYTDASAEEAIFEGEIIAGVDTITYQLPGLDAGSYFFRCDVHPETMTGALEVK